MLVPELAELDRCRGFGLGTSSSREELRALFPIMGGGDDVDEEDRAVSDEDVEELEMVGASVGDDVDVSGASLCVRKGY